METLMAVAERVNAEKFLRSSFEHDAEFVEGRLIQRPAPHRRFHLSANAEILSSIATGGFGCCGALCEGASTALIESAMRLFFTSTFSTCTFTICPTFTASD